MQLFPEQNKLSEHAQICEQKPPKDPEYKGQLR